MRRLLLLVAVTGCFADSPAGEYHRASLFERTPFAEVGKGAPAVSAGGPYELRGFFGPADAREVSIRRTDTGESRWVLAGDSGDQWRVESADIDAGTAVLLVDGMRLKLRLPSPDYAARLGSEDAGPGKRTGPQNYDLTPNGDTTPLSRAREAGLNRLRADHPEYFTDINAMPEDRRREVVEAIGEVNRQAAAAVSRASSGL